MQAPLASARILYDSCPLCASREIRISKVTDCSQHPLYKPAIPPVMTWMSCSSCTHVFTDGYFTSEALSIIFSNTHERQKVGFDVEGQRIISSRMIEKVLPHMQAGYWLDIGFGNGSLLLTAEEYGFIPVGVDLRKDNVAVMQQMGFEAHCIDVNELDHANRYSVISMADVLEHMPYPGRTLQTAYRLLGDGGVLLLSMPNMDCMSWKFLDHNRANPYWVELEHYHNFGRSRLYALLREYGFEPLRYGISERYRVCMEVVARKRNSAS